MTDKLNNTDIEIMTQIIRASLERGAIKPEELIPVGNLYNKLVAMLPPAPSIPSVRPSSLPPTLKTLER